MLIRVCGKKFFVGGGVWASAVSLSNRRGQLANFQGKSTLIFPPITPRSDILFEKKSLKVLAKKVFRCIQSALDRKPFK
ncbi:MAG: hypothetical protein DWQ54_22260 [Microcystis flos-aquae TF09]|uniref:Uncharacterized protein n=1 Tax=Microcystis flos-aquae TF09 TaxID=2060473 RepID=A0A3E0KW39_9CHRO|nr:MAG: hypothetical protein DWQ54_22260 [Microcystis flos-aquae TF09]